MIVYITLVILLNLDAFARVLAQQRVTVTAGRKHSAVPIVDVGKRQYIPLRSLGRALGVYRPPDEFITSSICVRWSAPGFFLSLKFGDSTHIVQSAIPSIVINDTVLIPLDECMNLLASNGILVWNRRALHADLLTGPNVQKVPSSLPTRTPRYQLPPLLKRPTFQQLKGEQAQSRSFSIRRSSEFLAALPIFPTQSSDCVIERIEPIFQRDTTLLYLTCTSAIEPAWIKLEQDGSVIKVILNFIQLPEHVLKPLKRVRLSRYSVQRLNETTVLTLVLIRSDRSVDLVFSSARRCCIRIYPNVRILRRAKWSLDCIVLDAGHGGKDVGAIGVNGTQEKDVALAIAQLVRQYFRAMHPDIRVVLTRDEDSFLELHRRGQIANQVGGKLFVSLHCNSTPTKPHPARGTEVYVLSPARSSEAASVAARENASIRLEHDTTVYSANGVEQYILAALVQRGYSELSHRLALVIDSTMVGSGFISRGVHSAGFLVLVGASMPAVLVEIGFLSNPTEERLLASKRGQKRIANVIARALNSFVRQYEKLTSAALYDR